MHRYSTIKALLCFFLIVALIGIEKRVLPRVVPVDEPSGANADPCEGLAPVQTPISALLPKDCSVAPQYCFNDVARIIPLEAGCYIEDVVLKPVEEPTPIAHFAPPIILVGQGPDKTIIAGRGTRSAVVSFLKNANGIGGGQLRDVKIKPAYGQDGVYFEMSEIWCLLGGPNTGGECTSSLVQNTVIKGAKNGIVMDAGGYASLWGEVRNNTIAYGTSHGIVALNGAELYTRNNLLFKNRGSAFWWDGDPEPTVFARYNDAWGNGINNGSAADHYPFNPRFIDEENFNLQTTSMALQAGVLDVPYISAYQPPLPTPLPGTPTPLPTATPTPLPTALVDLGAYGKAELLTPVPAQPVQASRRKPYVDLDWIDAADDVAVKGYAMYRSTSESGPWVFTHSCVLPPFWPYGDPACASEYVLNDPTPFPTPSTPIPGPTPSHLAYFKLVPFDTSFNRGPDSNLVSPPTDPVPYSWSVYRDSPHCNSSWNVKMRFIPGSRTGITAGWLPETGVIDQYEIWHCWKPNGVKCDKVGYVNAPTADNIYQMHVPCDTKAHYYMFRGREKYGPPPSGGRFSYSPYRTYSSLGSSVRICMVSPDTCTDCAFATCTSPTGNWDPCPSGGVCPPDSVYPEPQHMIGELSVMTPLEQEILPLEQDYSSNQGDILEVPLN